jgi:transposase InsO family protein
MVVVSPLTSEAILGLDFLQAQQAVVDLGNKTLSLRESGCSIPFDTPAPVMSCANIQQVRTSRTVEVSGRSVTEVPAYFDTPGDGVWLLEEAMARGNPLAIARAIIEPTSTSTLVCVLNASTEPVTLYAGAVIATIQPIDLPVEVGGIDCQVPDVDEQKREVLWKLVEGSAADLTPGEREIFYNLLLSYADVMASSTSDLGRTGRLQHRIDTGTSPPIRQAVRRISPHRREEVRELLNQMQERGVIEPSSSPWASPVVLVQKKDGSTRFCADYRKLNHVTRKDAYPLPRIDMTLDALHGSRWFTTLDLLSVYWQVEMNEADKEKTAFCTTEGLYQFRVMPFGLCNAPASFQRLMDLVLSGLQWSQCLVYLDDIIVLGRSFEEHIHNLQSVFSRLRESGLRLKPSKCSFFQREVRYLGHIISCEGVSADPDKIAKVADWPVPTSKREAQQFLGFANYYRRFIKGFAELARPLHRLTERTSSFAWTTECQNSFDQLRMCLCSSPILAYPDFRKPFILDTDASDTGIGGVLSQIDDEGRERAIAYGNRLLTKPERQYCVTRRELLAVVTFVQHYRPYLICRKFTLRTDHGSLTWLRNFKEPEGQLARWLERLQELDFEVVHRRGASHGNADSLSRLPCRQCGRADHRAADASTEVAVLALQLPTGQASDSLRQSQLADPTLAPLLHGKEACTKPDSSSFAAMTKSTRRLLQIWEQLVVHQGVLCRRLPSMAGSPEKLQTVVPEALREEVLADLHEGTMGGHLGSDKTLGRLKERFYWPGHYNDVKEWCRNCATCAVRKSPPAKPRAPLEPIVTGYPMQLVAMDIVGPFPESTRGNSYILVVADYFTRYTEAYAIPNQEASTVANKLVDEFFFRFSPPEQLHSDQGRNFESTIIAEVCKLLGVKKSRTTPYHPQSDGLVERFNRTLLDMLATAVRDRPFEWEMHLRRLCLAYNTSIHPTTGFSPFYLMYGRQARLPVDIMLGTATPPASPIPQYVANLHTSLCTAYEYVRTQMKHKLEQQKDRYDTRTHGKPFQSGDLVWLHNPTVARGQSKKLHQPWTGPYKIASKLSECVACNTSSIVAKGRWCTSTD